MEIAPFGPDDTEAVAAMVAIRNAIVVADSPWMHPTTVRELEGNLRHGWDGEPDLPLLGTEDGVPVAFGRVATSEYDNHHLAWLGVQVHPDHRRRGLGSRMLEAVIDKARSLGRTSAGTDAWDLEGPAAFAARHGFEPKSAAVNRRQVLADVDFDDVARRRAAALPHAGDYELLQRAGATPDDELEAVAQMSAAINDAPTDDLDIEDNVFSAERIRAYEHAQEARGYRLYRVLARHRGTGELAGHSVVVVDADRPALGEQHDTSVLGGHRGHRLGLLLKAEMNLWLREVEPQVETIDTWNAESNAHMIGVNEVLGYRVLGRELEYQRSI